MKTLERALLVVGFSAGIAAAQTIIVPTACVLENARPDSTSDGPYLQNDPPTGWWNSSGIISNQTLIADGAPLPTEWPQHQYGYVVASTPRVRDTAETVGGTSGAAELTFDLGGVVEVDGIVLWNHGEGAIDADASDRGIATAGISWSSNGVDFISTGETLTFAKGPQDPAQVIDADPQYLTSSLPGVTHLRIAATNFNAHTILGFAEIRMIGSRPPDLYYVASTPVDWNDATAWSDGNPATASRNYVVTNNVVLKTPAVAETFAGETLTLQPDQRMDVMVSDTNVVVNSLTLNAAELAAGAGVSGEAQIAGVITVSSNSLFAGATDDSRDLRITSRVNGGASATVELAAPTKTIYIDNAANALSGTWVVSDGTAEFANAGAVGSASIVVSNGTLSILGDWNGLSNSKSLTVADSAGVAVNLGTYAWRVESLMVGTSNVLTGFTYDADALNAIGSATFTGTGTVQVGIPYVPPAAPNSLTHHWKFDEADGAIAADSAGGRDGAIDGAVWGSDGVRSSFLTFDGSNDRVDPALVLPQWTDTNAETWAVWVNSAGGNNNDIILGNRKDGTTEAGGRLFAKFTERPDSNGRFVFNDGVGTLMNLSDGGRSEALPVGEWYHLAIVRDGADFTFYVDGVAYSNSSYSISAMPAAGMPFFIGGESGLNATEHFAGSIDDVVIYNYALTAENVVDVMNGIYDFGEVDLSVGITDYSFNPSGTSTLSFTGGVSSAYVIKSTDNLAVGVFTTITPTAATTGTLEGDVITTDVNGDAIAEFSETAPAQFYKVESAP